MQACGAQGAAGDQNISHFGPLPTFARMFDPDYASRLAERAPVGSRTPLAPLLPMDGAQ